MNAVYESKSEPIYFIIDSRLSQLPHLHKEIEIIYVKEGKSAAIADRNRYMLNRGDLFIAFPNQIHYYDQCETGCYYVAIMTPDILLGLQGQLRSHVPLCNIIHTDEDDPIRGILQSSAQLKGEYRLTALNGYMNLLISNILSQITLKPLILSDNSSLHSVLDYCSHHFSAELSLDMLASELHLNKYYISHLLNKSLNLGFNDYINTLRVNAACDLLGETEQKIADISEDVGFGTIRSFNRAFQRLMNMTPGDYRESVQKNQEREFR